MKADKSVTMGAVAGHAWQVSARTVDMTRKAPAVRALAIDADPQNIVVDANKSALLIVDMQNDFCATGGWIDSMGIDVSPNRRPIQPLKRLIKGFRAHAMPVIWSTGRYARTCSTSAPRCAMPTARAAASRALAGRCQDRARRSWRPAAGARRWSTRSIPAARTCRSSSIASAPSGTPRRTPCCNLGIKTLFVGGVNMDQCVMTTLEDASFLGYDTVLVEDGTATTSPEYCVKAVLFNVKRLFGFIVRSEAILRAIKST